MSRENCRFIFIDIFKPLGHIWLNFVWWKGVSQSAIWCVIRNKTWIPFGDTDITEGKVVLPTSETPP